MLPEAGREYFRTTIRIITADSWTRIKARARLTQRDANDHCPEICSSKRLSKRKPLKIEYSFCSVKIFFLYSLIFAFTVTVPFTSDRRNLRTKVHIDPYELHRLACIKDHRIWIYKLL